MKSKEAAYDLAMTLKHNKELVNDPERFDELRLVLELRFEELEKQVKALQILSLNQGKIEQTDYSDFFARLDKKPAQGSN